MAFLCRGALMNMGQPIGTNFAMEMVPKETQALANSLTMLAWTASWALSTQLGGWVIENHGYTQSFVIAAGLYAASAVLYYYYFSRSEKKMEGGYSVVTDTRA
jgi:predicted MFS family arabinose efflux permease